MSRDCWGRIDRLPSLRRRVPLGFHPPSDPVDGDRRLGRMDCLPLLVQGDMTKIQFLDGRFVLYSKFGSRLTPISKHEDANGRITVQATAEGASDVRDYQINDLKADEGSTEISDIISKLPAKVIEDIPSARKRIANLPQNDRDGSRFGRRQRSAPQQHARIEPPNAMRRGRGKRCARYERRECLEAFEQVPSGECRGCRGIGSVALP